MSRNRPDNSLDLHEAIQILELLFFTFERADNQQDWFTMREPVGSGIFAAQRLLGRALQIVEGKVTVIEGRPH